MASLLEYVRGGFDKVWNGIGSIKSQMDMLQGRVGTQSRGANRHQAPQLLPEGRFGLFRHECGLRWCGGYTGYQGATWIAGGRDPGEGAPNGNRYRDSRNY